MKMEGIRITIQIAILYLFYMLGIWIQTTFELFIPGSVIGMVLFLSVLLSGIYNPRWTEAGASFLIRHLPLLFLPITVGVMEYFELFKGRGLWIVFVVLFSTMLVMISSGAVTQWLMQRKERGSE